jgi:transcriptional regulator with XRE-family HTH domain
MEAHNLPEALNLIMEQRGCSGSQLARDLGVSQSWLSDAARGKKDTPTAKAIRLLASVGWELVIRPKREEDPVKRREFVTAAASVTFIPSPKVGPYEDPANVEALARRMAGARFEHGGGAIASTAIRHVRRIESAIASRDRKLQEAAAGLAVQTVWTLNDACRINAGENVGRLALKLAKASGSPRAQSLAYSALISLNLDHGAPDRALMYANKGAQLQETPDLPQAWMRLKKGWTLAHIPGQKNRARDEIETISGLLQDTQGFYRQSSSESYRDGRAHAAVVADMIGNIGLSLSDLGMYQEAQATFNECVRGLEESTPALAAFFVAHQVQTALTASHVPLAADRMVKLAHIAPLVNSPRVDECLREVLRQSAGWAKEPRIRNARDQLKAVTPPTPQT